MIPAVVTPVSVSGNITEIAVNIISRVCCTRGSGGFSLSQAVRSPVSRLISTLQGKKKHEKIVNFHFVIASTFYAPSVWLLTF